MNDWGWANRWRQTLGYTSGTSGSLSYWPTMITSSGTEPYYVQPQPLAPVLESPSARLDDREWLDAQIQEVCELAEAA